MARSSGNSAHAHGQLVHAESHTQWPGILFSYYMGETTQVQVIAAMQAVTGKERKKRECVGYFFLGQQRLLVGDVQGARDAFQKTLATRLTTFRQYSAAAVELDRLSSQ